MNDKTQYIITCRFSPWGYNGKIEYPAFGVKYLIEVDIEEKNIEQVFKDKFKEKIKKDFDGEILFIEEVNFATI